MPEAPVNFLSGSPLNRLSWLRSCTPFLNAGLASHETRWILFRAGEPLIQVHPATDARDAAASRRQAAGESASESESQNFPLALVRLPTSSVSRLLGPTPIFGQGPQPGQCAEEASGGEKNEGVKSGEHPRKPEIHHGILEALRLHGPPVVFLGLHEPTDAAMDNSLPSSEFSTNADPSVAVAKIRGTLYFALDVSGVPPDELDLALRDAEAQVGAGASSRFSEPKTATFGLSFFDASLFAEARSMIDWNGRNKFCPYCGSPTYSLWAGWKLGCSSLLPWTGIKGKTQCISAKGINNFSHPRVDPAVIMIILDETGERCLLGRNKKFPGAYYSALAGFLEPGEAFEDAVRREIWEEAGVRVWDVTYHSSQPWPYPSTLMVGFYAYADPSKPIRLDLDTELIDARWFTREEVLSVLSHPSLYGGSRERKINNDTITTRAMAVAGAGVLAGQLNAEPHAPGRNSEKTKESVESTNASSGDAQTSADLAPSPPPLQPPPFRVPPTTAIAGVLIRDWAEGRIGPRANVGNKSIGRSPLQPSSQVVTIDDAASVKTNRL